MHHVVIYAGLFAAALLSATILPIQSEIPLLGLFFTNHYPTWLLIAVASVGNTLGSVINWLLGRYIAQFEGRRWFPVKRDTIAWVESWYRRYGQWSLLLSWAPVIGDPLTIMAGVLREPLPTFIILVGIAKTARYIAVVAASSGWM